MTIARSLSLMCLPSLARVGSTGARARVAGGIRPAVVLLWCHVAAALAGPAAAAVERTVHWSPSPLRDAGGNHLPPAAVYEVWLTVDTRPESLAAVVPDTQKVLVLEAGSTYVVRVRARSATGALSTFSEPSDPYEVPKEVAGVGGPPPPTRLGPAWPNPFNARVTLPYHVPEGLPADAPFMLTIHDLRGCLVANLTLDRRPGPHAADWSGCDRLGRRLPSGIYIARYTCGRDHASLRLTLVS